MVHAGMVLAGKYQVERVLGQGGMGCVVSAFHLQLGQRVAIKFLLPEALAMREAVERFLREARAAVRLRSEHVGRVIDVGQFENGAPYMVMEYLDGMDLSGYLQRAGVMPVVQAVDFLLQACEAIAEAHSLGIVHRDLKPANLFLTQRADGGPLIKVLDFGISKAKEAEGAINLTRTTSVMGSPGYMSPEQLRSTKDCDARSDIWALGVILYELTCGRQPFGGDSITELALKVAMDPTPAMNLSVASPGFEQAVHRCLQKDPAHRFQNIAELAAALVPYGPGTAMEAAMRVARVLQINPSNLSMTPTMIGGGGKPTTLSHAAGTYGTQSRGGAMPAKKGRGGLIAGILVGAVAIGGGVIAFTMMSKSSGGASESAPAAGKAGNAATPGDDSPDKAGNAKDSARAVDEARAEGQAEGADQLKQAEAMKDAAEVKAAEAEAKVAAAEAKAAAAEAEAKKRAELAAAAEAEAKEARKRDGKKSGGKKNDGKKTDGKKVGDGGGGGGGDEDLSGSRF